MRGLLDTTPVARMGEFGRTSRCTGGGHDHWARAWNSAPGDGGIKGGQVVGRDDRHAAAAVDRPQFRHGKRKRLPHLDRGGPELAARQSRRASQLFEFLPPMGGLFWLGPGAVELDELLEGFR